MFEIYCDGAVSGNGYDNAVGGWAYVVLKEGLLIHKESGQEKDPKLATNQRMELTAILRACEYVNELDPFATVKIYSDSAYCVNCFKQNWWRAWEKNGWVNSKKQPVANQDLWEKLIYFWDILKFFGMKLQTKWQQKQNLDRLKMKFMWMMVDTTISQRKYQLKIQI